VRRTLLLAGALSFILSNLAAAQPGANTNRPTTRPAQGQKPVAGQLPAGGNQGGGGRPGGGGGKPPGGGGGRPPGGGGGGGGKPPGGGGAHPRPPHGGTQPPHHKPPNYKPPHYRPPNTWHPPRGNQWYWHGRWVGRINGPAFFYPPGYAYQRWNAGAFLPAIFLSAAYYYDSYVTLGLYAPPLGYRWVRYGPDLLLVNMTTGRVADVAYGVFL
jgi:hypothetical protein